MPQIAPIPVRSGRHFKYSLIYIANPNKAPYTTAINCPDDIDASINLFKTVWDFDTDFKKYKGKKANIAQHYEQSFKPGTVSAKEAHEIGVELTKIIAPGYMCHVATHTDRHHIHNHIIIFAVHPETGYKYRHTWDQYKFAQEQSDAICIERGIPIIENPKKRNLSTGEYRAIERGGSWKDKLAWDIDDAIRGAVADSSGKEGFIKHLKAQGYTVKYQNKNISIELPGNKAIRVDRLAKTYSSQYTKANIERRLQGEELIPVDDMNSAAAAEIPLHMKYGDTSRFNEYDRYVDWSMKKNKEIFMEARKRSPPDLEIYRPRHKDQQHVFKESYDKELTAKEVRQENKEGREKGGEERKIRSFRDKLAWDIDEAIKSAAANGSGKEGFISYLRTQGYIVKYQNKNISIQIPGRKAIRVDNLAKTHGNQYTKENIERRLEGQYQDTFDKLSKLPYGANTDLFEQYGNIADKEEHKEVAAGTKMAYSRRWINLFGGIKSTHRNKYGKTKDEREIEREMEDIGRAIGRALRGKKLKAKPIKGTWTMNETINKEKKREKER